MDPRGGRKLNIVAAAGLAVGSVFGLAGTLVTDPHLQAALWAIDSVGLVMATTLLTVKFLRKGCDVIAAGFLVFAIGESVILSGTAAQSFLPSRALECFGGSRCSRLHHRCHFSDIRFLS